MEAEAIGKRVKIVLFGNEAKYLEQISLTGILRYRKSLIGKTANIPFELSYFKQNNPNVEIYPISSESNFDCVGKLTFAINEEVYSGIRKGEEAKASFYNGKGRLRIIQQKHHKY